MINMGHYNVMQDNLEDYLNKQGYTLNGWGDNLTKAIRYVKVLETWGFVNEKEAQLIYNKITIRVITQAQEMPSDARRCP